MPYNSHTWNTTGEYDCPDCAALDGESRSPSEWMMTVMPGFHPNCDCVLIPDPASYYSSYRPHYYTEAEILNFLAPSAHTYFITVTGITHYISPHGYNTLNPWKPIIHPRAPRL